MVWGWGPANWLALPPGGGRGIATGPVGRKRTRPLGPACTGRGSKIDYSPPSQQQQEKHEVHAAVLVRQMGRKQQRTEGADLLAKVAVVAGLTLVPLPPPPHLQLHGQSLAQRTPT